MFLLRALKHKNYRLFFAGQGISLIGTWMQQTAVAWLAYSITKSPFYLGAVTFAGQIPIFAIAPFAGILADKWSKQKMLVATQIFSMLQALLLAIFVITGTITAAKIIILSLFLGIINSFDIPIRQSFVYEMVDNPQDLPNAIALNSLIFNGARLIGPSMAGILISLVGESICFLLNAVSYIAVIFALLAMNLSHREIARHNGTVLTGLKDGIIYAYRFVPIRTILLALALISLVGMPYAVLMPVFAKDILQGGPRTLGFLTGAIGIGALTGAIFLAWRKSIHNLDKVMVISISIFAAGILTFSMSENFPLSMCLLLFTGFGMLVLMASINTILQTIVDDDKRGRIMSLQAIAFMGTMPIGSLLSGYVAHRIGAPLTVQISGLLCMIIAAILWKILPAFRAVVHPIYIRKGIMPEISSGTLIQ